jgi:DNA-binding NarL/FixJ family response regulator
MTTGDSGRQGSIRLVLADDHALVRQGLRSLLDLTPDLRVARGVAELPRDFPHADLPEGLTRREVEVLRLIARGLSNREIAQAFGTAEGTVKNQTSSILSKLGVRDRTRAVLRAMELGCL